MAIGEKRILVLGVLILTACVILGFWMRCRLAVWMTSDAYVPIEQYKHDLSALQIEIDQLNARLNASGCKFQISKR
jgi:hypothetical protein